MNKEIRLVIADDHPIVRRGLRQVIESDSRLLVVAEANDGAEALRQMQELQPDVLVLDIDMPGLDGFATVREMQKLGLNLPVIFLTLHSEEDMFHEAMDLGARGYVLKESAVTEIVNAIKAAAAGQRYMTPALTSHLLSGRARSQALTEQMPALQKLTPAERRILQLIAADKSSKEIAAELFIHYRTVENHRTNICQKLGLHGHHALFKFVLQHKTEL